MTTREILPSSSSSSSSTGGGGMMDFSAFSDDNFNAKQWVNAALQAHKVSSEEGVDAHATMLVMKLQLHSLELTNSLEETSTQALLSIPRAILEIEKVRKEATALKQKMVTFKQQLSSMEDKTDRSVEILETLDKVKERMELCMRALKEASKLATFGQNIESVFTSNDYLKIATTIRELRDSLKIVGDVPEFKDQARQLAKYQDRLEGMLRPQLLSAINKRQEEVTVTLREVFKLIDRLDQFQQHYISCRLVPIRQAWDSYTSDISFPTWLPTFYDQLLGSLSSDTAWAQKIFPDSAQYQSVSTQLLVTSLQAFSSSFQSRLDATLFPPNPIPAATSPTFPSGTPTSPNPVHHSQPAVQQNLVPKLNILIAAYAVAHSFAASVGAIIPDSKNRTEVIRTIYEPFIPFQRKYPTYEKQTLLANVATLKPAQTGFLETVRQVVDTIGKVVIFAEAAIERCLQFTQGVAAEGLVASLSDFFNEYIKQLFSLLQFLRVKARLEPDATISVPAPAVVPPEPHGHESVFLEGALKLFDSSNQLSHRITNFDKYARTHLLAQKTFLNTHAGRSGEPTYVELQLKEDKLRLKNLEKFYRGLENASASARLLPVPCQHAVTFNVASQAFVFDIMFAYVKERISSIPQLEDWRALPKPNDAGLDLPTYQHPLTYITQIGEHLLTTLPQQLEPHADTLSRPLTLDDKARKKSTPTINPAFSAPSTLVTPLSHLKANSLVDSNGIIPDPETSPTAEQTTENGEKKEEKEEEVEEEVEDDDDEEGTVAHQWIAAIAKGAMSLYVKKIMEIPVLSRSGAKQLDIDIGYLFKVLSALAISPDHNLIEVQRLVAIPTKEEYLEAVKTVDPAYAPFANSIGNMRGILKP